MRKNPATTPGTDQQDGDQQISLQTEQQHAESYDPVLAATGLYMCHLVACALRGVHAENDSKPGGVTWANVYTLAKRNSIEAITWMGLPEHPNEPISDDLRAVWEKSADLTLFRQLNFDAAREEIGRRLLDHGISFMALKGVHTSAYYPQPGMRSMGDNDLLFDMIEPIAQSQQSTVVGSASDIADTSTSSADHTNHTNHNAGYQPQGKTDQEKRSKQEHSAQILFDIMHDLGYTLQETHNGMWEFDRPPQLSFEMFQSIAMPRSAHYRYYRNPWARTVPDDPQSFAEHGCGQMHWPIEDQYLFHLSHMFKHYDEGGGCGIRFAIDEYVFLQAMRDADWQYIGTELETMHLTDFERRVRRVALIAFGGESLRNELTMNRIAQGKVTATAERGVAGNKGGVAGRERGAGEMGGSETRGASGTSADIAADTEATSDNDASSPEDMDFLYFLLTCGIYGNVEFQIAHDLRKAQASGCEDGGSLRYLRRRLFPPYALLISTYPWLEGKPWLVPFMPIYRLVHGLTHNSGKILTELKILIHRR
ncbi:hypothetical protein BHAP_0793 [Bifidobacterium hapali]|uniref:Nucleotidyltransferase family protein n=1 Tax=Bifidobacterium hapali TaxID=1630172 RepID=A0A261G0F2_9BIFI|nr:nucleotidyltransferase family protein [Bifidobacterium hapali]OZG64901.1 hypothetical protein BHAP_0793 [Bifidobacterium hapali]